LKLSHVKYMRIGMEVNYKGNRLILDEGNFYALRHGK
jgi:hypothetical protein